MKVSLKNRARLDLADIASWYAEQRVDLAEAFKREFLVCIERISLQPNMYPEAEDGVRRASLRRFPYIVYYTVGEDIQVLRIYHESREPGAWEVRDVDEFVRSLGKPPGILSEPHHHSAVLEARQRFLDNPDQGEELEDVMARLRSRLR